MANKRVNDYLIRAIAILLQRKFENEITRIIADTDKGIIQATINNRLECESFARLLQFAMTLECFNYHVGPKTNEYGNTGIVLFLVLSDEVAQ